MRRYGFLSPVKSEMSGTFKNMWFAFKEGTMETKTQRVEKFASVLVGGSWAGIQESSIEEPFFTGSKLFAALLGW